LIHLKRARAVGFAADASSKAVATEVDASTAEKLAADVPAS